MREHNFFNQILLNLFNVLNVFHDSFLANIEVKNMSNGINKQLKCYEKKHLKRQTNLTKFS